MSMIYGLGDYTGGAICVEGTASDIRYAPIGFGRLAVVLTTRAAAHNT